MQLGVPIPQVGTTTFRPPYTPVTLGAFPGHGARSACRADTPHGDARRGTPSRARASSTRDCGSARIRIRAPANRKTMRRTAKRATCGRTSASSTCRRWARSSCRDATSREFLNRIYANRFDNLPVGRCRYGVMLREDGIVRDDGTTSRLDATHYLMTTTTANAVAVMQHVERLLQVDWPELDVYATSVTEQLVGRGGVRTEVARTRCGARRHRRLERRVSVPRRRVVQRQHGGRQRFRRVCSG